MVAAPPAIRITIAIRWAISLFVLFALRQEAKACPILVDQSATIFAYSFTASIKTGCVFDQNRVTQFDVFNKGNTSEQDFEGFDIGSAQLTIGNDSEFGVLTESLISITRLALNSSARLENNSLRVQSISDNDTGNHDIDVALYYALYDINPDLATGLLSSYRSINRVGSDISNAIEEPLNAIGLGGNSAFPELNVTSPSFPDTSSRRIMVHHTDIDIIAGWIRFLLSLDALPYYTLISSVFILLSAISIARSRRS